MIIRVFRKRPWLWVVVAFIVLILAWVVLYNVALKKPVIHVEPGKPLPEGVIPGSGHPSAQDGNGEGGDQ